MKTRLLIPLVLILGITMSCQNKIDVAKEEAAIKALIEADRAAYFKQDYNGVGDCWIKEPSSVKIWVDGSKETKIVGWDNINESQKKESENISWDRNKSKVTFSNYQFDIDANFAWVYYEADWEAYTDDGIKNLRQGRIVILKKSEGKWKYALFLLYKKE